MPVGQRKPTYARQVWLAPTSTREALSFRNICIKQSRMTDFYAASNRIPEHVAPETPDIYQPQMIDFYGRKGEGGGESLAELAHESESKSQPKPEPVLLVLPQPEPEPEPEPEILAQP